MPRVAAELSAIVVGRLKTPGFHAVGGVAGLLLKVSNPNARSWVLRVTIGGKRREIGLGSFNDVSLAEARTRARKLRSDIADGVDPLAERRKASADLAAASMSVLTFDEAARRLIAAKAPEWKNPKHAAQWAATLETYASPTIGKLPVNEVELRHVVDVLSPIWETTTETARRLRGRIESVLAWATVSGYRTGDNPARWKGNLDHVLAKPNRIRKVKHHAALPVDDLHGFMADLRQREGMGARALEFAILTAARSGEVRGATWSEIDLDGAVWTIPANRMKGGREHRVPLSAPAAALLRAMPRDTGETVFFAPRGGEMSDMSLSAVMRRMEVDAVPHGFRSTFRDWSAERTAYPRDVCEMALAHTIGDKVEAAYRRGDLFAKRTNLMADWAKFIDTAPATGNVTPMRKEAI